MKRDGDRKKHPRLKTAGKLISYTAGSFFAGMLMRAEVGTTLEAMIGVGVAMILFFGWAYFIGWSKHNKKGAYE